MSIGNQNDGLERTRPPAIQTASAYGSPDAILRRIENVVLAD
ncbi:hypothetical protein [Aliidongia dinghuensis]|nr:hypothetical protein [Aliidongia dinghuensis]